MQEYREKFGEEGTGFAESFNDLSTDDPRYQKWLESLKKRPEPWSKGHTKETHPGVAKISETLKNKRIDNFSKWREANPVVYKNLEKDDNLAFIIGMILGDGNIHVLDRTEQLRITLGTDKPKLWKYTAALIEIVFGKKPNVSKVKGSECMTITLYRKNLSKDLSIPSGNRGNIAIKLPNWIVESDEYLRQYLRGLYEAEGSFCVHRPTYTHKMIFSNRNDTLLQIVYTGLVRLGFHPHKSRYAVQISKKDEVYALKGFLSFREYPNISG